MKTVKRILAGMVLSLLICGLSAIVGDASNGLGFWHNLIVAYALLGLGIVFIGVCFYLMSVLFDWF